ncbi:MAG: SIS domain-containing protein [Anaerovoracaceae bacterium]
MSDKLYDKIIDKLDSFSSGQQKVAKYIVDNYSEIPAMSCKELAGHSHVSSSMVVRFAKHIGCSGFLQIRDQIRSELGNVRRPYSISLSMPEKVDDNLIGQYLQKIGNDIKVFTQDMDLKLIEKLASDIAGADTVYLFGIGGDRIIVQYLSNYFPLLGIKTAAIFEEGLGMKQKIMNMTPDDFLIVASFPNVQRDEFWITDFARKNGTGVFLITDSDITARYHGISNYIKVKNSLNTFYNSCILSMYFCDILLMKLVIAPLITFAVLKIWASSYPADTTLLIDMGMPVAVMSALLSQKYDNDTALATKAILISTLGLFVSVPLCTLLISLL